jgi:hypothetical protein
MAKKIKKELAIKLINIAILIDMRLGKREKHFVKLYVSF